MPPKISHKFSPKEQSVALCTQLDPKHLIIDILHKHHLGWNYAFIIDARRTWPLELAWSLFPLPWWIFLLTLVKTWWIMFSSSPWWKPWNGSLRTRCEHVLPKCFHTASTFSLRQEQFVANLFFCCFLLDKILHRQKKLNRTSGCRQKAVCLIGLGCSN